MTVKTYSITANADDILTNLRQADGSQLAWATFMAIGLVSGETLYWPHMRFAGVNIPAGALNVTAKIRIRWLYRQGEEFFYGVLRSYLADDVPVMPVSTPTANSPNLRVNLSQSSTVLDRTGAATSGFDYAAPWVEYDVTAQLAEVRARPGYVPGNAIVFTGDPTGANNFAYMNSVESTAAQTQTDSAQLVITYDVPLEDRVAEAFNAVGKDVKRLDARIDAVGSGGSVADPSIIVTKHRVKPYPQVHRMGSRWYRRGVGSGSYASESIVRAVPLDVSGLDILGFVFGVQGSLTGTGNFVEVGIYDSDPTTGMPRNLLAQAVGQVTGGGNMTINLATPLLASAHNGRLWMGYAYTAASGSSVQFNHAIPTGVAGTEIGYLEGINFEGINSEIANNHIISANTITGTAGTNARVWPSTFGDWTISGGQQFPNMNVRVRRPAS